MRMTSINKYPTTLQGIDSRFICIPNFIISHHNKKVLALFMYIIMRAGMDYCVDFSFFSLFQWYLYKSNSHKNDTFYQFVEAIQFLIDNNIIFCNNCHFDISKITFKSNIDLMVNINNINKINDIKYFAKIYIDEVLDIRDFYKQNPPNNFIDTLVVLAYLRLNIRQRNNTDVEKINPEAYYNYYKKIYTELGIGKKTFSRCINVLSNELLIIYLVHSKYQYIKGQNEKGNVITLPTIFCNYYRRDKNTVTDGEIKYCETETKKAYKKMMEKFDIKKAINIKRDTSIEDSDVNEFWFSNY